MSEYKKVKLGDIFTLEKGSLQSSKCTPGQYDFITAAEDWKTHESYTHDCEAIVYAVAASGSLGRAHYVNGKFIASDLCFIMQEKDKEKFPVNFQFYQIIFEVLRDEIVSKTKTGTSKESISQKNLSKYEIPYFDYDFQIANYERLVRTKQIIAEISKETESQKAYAKQLRQNILQDAIEGKLTAEWRKTHPVIKGNPDFDAEALFEEIRKKKKSDKKQKELAPIGDDEKTFEIPEGWKWVRLGEICKKITDGTHHSPINTPDGDYMYVTAKNIKTYGVDLSEITYVSKEIHDEIYKRCNVEYGDILYIKDGATTGIVCINNLKEQFSLLSSVALLKPAVLNSFLKYSMESPTFYEQTRNQMYGVAITRVTLEKIINAVIPLPSLQEQMQITENINKQLIMIDQLEQQITQREEYANQLMQSILKDAFEER